MTEKDEKKTEVATPREPVLIMAKRAKNGMLILTAPNLDDYPCGSDQDISDAVNSIVDDPEQPRTQQVSAGFESGSPPESGGDGGRAEVEDYDTPDYGSLTDKFIVEGISGLFNFARSASNPKKRR